jgi:hypothetical protein
MATVSIDYAISEIIDNNLICWSIKDNKALLTEQDDHTIKSEDSARMLKNKLTAIGNGIVTVNASGKPKKDRAGAETHKIRTFTIDLNQAARVTSVNSISDHNSREILNKELELIKTRFELEQAYKKIQELEKQITELEEEEEEEETIGGFSVKTLQTVLINQLLNGGNTTPPAAAPTINGINGDAWEQFKAKEPRALEIVSAVLNLMNNDPDTYKLVKNNLLK